MLPCSMVPTMNTDGETFTFKLSCSGLFQPANRFADPVGFTKKGTRLLGQFKYFVRINMLQVIYFYIFISNYLICSQTWWFGLVKMKKFYM